MFVLWFRLRAKQRACLKVDMLRFCKSTAAYLQNRNMSTLRQALSSFKLKSISGDFQIKWATRSHLIEGIPRYGLHTSWKVTYILIMEIISEDSLNKMGSVWPFYLNIPQSRRIRCNRNDFESQSPDAFWNEMDYKSKRCDPFIPCIIHWIQNYLCCAKSTSIQIQTSMFIQTSIHVIHRHLWWKSHSPESKEHWVIARGFLFGVAIQSEAMTSVKAILRSNI